MDDEEENLQPYGTPLEPLPEDKIPSKKPMAVEDQIVTDENGLRRFHGAFTGGFSAGFWNTVGSLEGWKPAEFKSSRTEKAPQRSQQRPEDFMDDEDLGEFGIAPQRIRAQNDFQIETANTSRKRKLFQNAIGTSGAIPGMPVLAELLRPVEDKIAVRILKSMGWKPGQGIGPRLTSKQKKKNRERNKREEYVLRRYGCSEESAVKSDEENVALVGNSTDDDADDCDNELTFAPDDYESLVCASKTNRFGLGYSGLDHETNISSKPEHINLFGPLEVMDKNNKKLSIRGQAFGVGALEEEDEDIYARDDLSKYDFTLDERKPKAKVQKPVQDRHIIEGFVSAKQDVQYQAPFMVEPPAGFQPRNWAMRKSRFAPLEPGKMQEIEEAVSYKKSGLGRHDLNPAQRSAVLEEKLEQQAASLQTAQQKRHERTQSLLERISAKSDNFTRGGVINTKGEEEMTELKQAVEQEQQSLLVIAANKTKRLGTTALECNAFKPFLGNDAKQQRYEKFLEAKLNDETEIAAFLATIQPVELSEWDRAMECKEFIQARKIYKPLGGTMSERFVSEASISVEKADGSKEGGKSEDTRRIVLKRSKDMWKPHPLLCKRYNIAEPFGGSMEETDLRPAKKAKLSIFDYLETSVNRKDSFQTPTIIPKHIEKPKAVVNNRTSENASVMQEKLKDIQLRPEEIKETSLQLPSVATSDAKHFKMPPKTELEKRAEESRDKPPSEKVELFRAIFEDSDDETEMEIESNEKSNLEIEKLELPSSSKALSAAAVNLLRNDSPPRGVFAALFTSKASIEKPTEILIESDKQKSENVTTETPVKITFKSRSERQQEAFDEGTYGPKLPTQIASLPHKSKADIMTDTRLLSLFEKHKSNTTVKDVWTERTNDNSGSSSSDSDSNSESSPSSDTDTNKRRKKKSKKSKKNVERTHEKKPSKKLKKKAKSKKASKKKKKKKKKVNNES